MKTAIRLDDISPDMDLNKFYRIKAILDECGIKPLIGVVPYNEDPNLHRSETMPSFGAFLQQLQNEGYVIALHGYHHVYTTKKGGLFPLNHFSEYAGVAYDRQMKMIRAGREALEKMGISTDIFMAPAHSYDHNTLKALKENGFTAVTDGFGERPYIRCGLTFYPIAVKKSDCFSKKEGYTTFVIHANSIEENEFAYYEKMIKDHKDSFISYTEYREVPARKCSLASICKEYATAVLKHLAVRIRTR